MKRKNLILICLFLMFFITGCDSNKNDNTLNNEKENIQANDYQQRKEKVLSEVENLIDNKNYDEASAKLVGSSVCHSYGYNCENNSYSIWDADCGTLYNYVYMLKEGYSLDNISTQKFLMKNSNPFYERKHKDDILALGLKLFGDTEKWLNFVKNEEEAQYDIYNKTCNTPIIGMTKQEIINSTWGRPTKVNKTTTSKGTTEQWVYKNNKYIYFNELGKVYSIQE